MVFDWRSNYIAWYRAAEEILGPKLVRHLTDREVVKWVSKRNWILLPLPTEANREQGKSRPDPNIHLWLDEDEAGWGIACNTVASVEKFRNILHELHAPERARLLVCMRQIEDGFDTFVSRKIKEYNFAQGPKYVKVWRSQSNRIDNKAIASMFKAADRIRERGLRRRNAEAMSHTPETPVIDIVRHVIRPPNVEMFKRQLAQAKPIFEVCLGVRSTSELRAAALRRLEELNRTRPSLLARYYRAQGEEASVLARELDVVNAEIKTLEDELLE